MYYFVVVKNNTNNSVYMLFIHRPRINVSHFANCDAVFNICDALFAHTVKTAIHFSVHRIFSVQPNSSHD